MLSWVSVDQARQVGTVLGDTPAVEGGVVSGPARACTQVSMVEVEISGFGFRRIFFSAASTGAENRTASEKESMPT